MRNQTFYKRIMALAVSVSMLASLMVCVPVAAADPSYSQAPAAAVYVKTTNDAFTSVAESGTWDNVSNKWASDATVKGFKYIKYDISDIMYKNIASAELKFAPGTGNVNNFSSEASLYLYAYTNQAAGLYLNIEGVDFSTAWSSATDFEAAYNTAGVSTNIARPEFYGSSGNGQRLVEYSYSVTDYINTAAKAGKNAVYFKLSIDPNNAYDRAGHIQTQNIKLVVDAQDAISNVRFTESSCVAGRTLEMDYDYNDTDIAEAVTINWYKADDSSKTNYQLISSGTSKSYPLTDAEETKYIYAEVVSAGHGNKSFSTPVVGPVIGSAYFETLNESIQGAANGPALKQIIEDNASILDIDLASDYSGYNIDNLMVITAAENPTLENLKACIERAKIVEDINSADAEGIKTIIETNTLGFDLGLYNSVDDKLALCGKLESQAFASVDAVEELYISEAQKALYKAEETTGSSVSIPATKRISVFIDADNKPAADKNITGIGGGSDDWACINSNPGASAGYVKSVKYIDYDLSSVEFDKIISAKIKFPENSAWGSTPGAAFAQKAGTFVLYGVDYSTPWSNVADFGVAYAGGVPALDNEIISQEWSEGWGEREIDVTAYLKECLQSGKSNMGVAFAYEKHTENSIASYILCDRVEFTIETEPSIKGAKITGNPVSGQTVSVENEYVGLYNSTDTTYEWCTTADKDRNDTQKISGETGTSLALYDGMVGRYIYACIYPVGSGGQYDAKNSVCTPLVGPVVSVSRYNSLETSLDNATTAGDYKTLITNNNDVFEIDLGSIDSTKLDRICAIMVNDKPDSIYSLKAVFEKCKIVDEVNNAAAADISTIITINKLGFTLDKFETISDKISLCGGFVGQNYISVAAFETDFEQKTAFYLFKQADRTNIKGLLTYYSDNFTTATKTLADNVLELAASKILLKQNDCSDFATFDSNLTTAITEAQSYIDSLNQQTPPGLGGGGGGGGGGGSKVDVTVPSAPAETEGTSPAPVLNYRFKDMEQAVWANDAVSKLYDLEIVNGTGDKTFEPNKNVTREEFSKMLALAFELEGGENYYYEDVDFKHWSYQYIKALRQIGVINGTSEHLFAPQQTIKREDMATMIHRLLTYKGVVLENENRSFADFDNVSDYARDSIAYLAGSGIINGKGENRFEPLSGLTRAEAAVVICRIMEAYKD